MKPFKHQFINDTRLFEVCRDIKGKDELYSVFEVHLNGSHFEYLYKNNATGEYSSTPESLLTAEEIIGLGEVIDEKLIGQDI
ncbi:hypothetical protein ACFSJU_12965 [Paradesertivirga mongoliensis]|uniref:Uncharacterized protein n=1 Tax=Paradesertivirga mongoliensis TaxID=2100740 RepID=A0ABW4ZN03_9SPHI|nr:hypothetical protein [Pedobacter mongoliensis]